MTSPIGYSCIASPARAANSSTDPGNMSSPRPSEIPHSPHIVPGVSERGRASRLLAGKEVKFETLKKEILREAGFHCSLVPLLERPLRSGPVRVSLTLQGIEIQIDPGQMWKLWWDPTPLDDALTWASALDKAHAKLPDRGFQLHEAKSFDEKTGFEEGPDYKIGVVPYMHPDKGNLVRALTQLQTNVASALTYSSGYAADFARARFIVGDRLSYTEMSHGWPVTRTYDVIANFKLPAENSVVIDGRQAIVWINPLAQSREPLADRVTRTINEAHAAILERMLEPVAAPRNFARLSIRVPKTRVPKTHTA